MLKKLWMDEGGATISAELALIGTILVIGVVVGLSSVQQAVVTELADIASAIGSLDQTYSYDGFQGHDTSTAGGGWIDALDQCDADDFCAQDGEASACVSTAPKADDAAGSGGRARRSRSRRHRESGREPGARPPAPA